MVSNWFWVRIRPRQKIYAPWISPVCRRSRSILTERKQWSCERWRICHWYNIERGRSTLLFWGCCSIISSWKLIESRASYRQSPTSREGGSGGSSIVDWCWGFNKGCRIWTSYVRSSGYKGWQSKWAPARLGLLPANKQPSIATTEEALSNSFNQLAGWSNPPWRWRSAGKPYESAPTSLPNMPMYDHTHT